ncbi:MAG: C40 family peptidase [Myxococcales bacterium]|nr:C40 family peptidase [Myxococcales bacterium]USN50930.1 MAG: C40 family peptidase [Myxococcales bacterium]
MNKILVFLTVLNSTFSFASDTRDKQNNFCWDYFSLKYHSESEVIEGIPSKIKNLLDNKSTAILGPNCWNAALYFLGAVSCVRFTSADEFEAFLQLPYFVEIKNNEDLLPGDLVVLKPHEQHQHAFIYLEEDLFIHKHGPSIHQVYEQVNWQGAIKNYLFTELVFNEARQKVPSLKIYRYNKNPYNLVNELHKMTFNVFKNIEKQTENLALGERAIENIEIKEILQTIKSAMQFDYLLEKYINFYVDNMDLYHLLQEQNKR